MPAKNDKLHQVNVTYSGSEDRLFLRFTTRRCDEYRIWMTRRFTAMLLTQLDKAMDKYGGVASLGANPKTKAMFKSGAMDKAFDDTRTRNFPLGKEGFLAYGVKSSETPEGSLHLEIFPEKGPGVSLNLDKPLLYMVHNLLMQGIARANWQLRFSQEMMSGQIH
jgi:hypothetical protein